MKFKLNDKVLVLSGKDKGKTGTILKLNKVQGLAVVGGVNIHKRHVKNRDGKGGGIIPQEAPFSVSNLSVICPNCEKKTRVSYKLNQTGKKERTCKKCKQAIIFPQETKQK